MSGPTAGSAVPAGRARTLAQVDRHFGEVAAAARAAIDTLLRIGANMVGLIDVGCSAGLNLNVDRVGVTYSNGQSLGDPSSPVQMSCSIVGDRPIPARAMPKVAAQVGVDLDPVDVTDADDARWLRACLGPDQPERIARLEAELTLAATAPPLLVAGPLAGVAGRLLVVLDPEGIDGISAVGGVDHTDDRVGCQARRG